MSGITALREAAGRWNLLESVVIAPSTNVGILIPTNADRWMFAVMLQSGMGIGACTISSNPNFETSGPAQTGITLSSTPMIFKYSDWGGFVQSAWYCFASSSPTGIVVWQAQILPELGGM